MTTTDTGWGFTANSLEDAADWGAVSKNSTSTDEGWGFETEVSAPYSGLEFQIVNARNRTRRVMTTVPDFMAQLAKLGIDGPHNIVLPGLDKWGKKIGAGAQFTVFIDSRRPNQNRVIKRINVFDTFDSGREISEMDAVFRKQLFTVETEILALCHPPLRNHQNIVKLFAWGYDYRNDSTSSGVPILYMERALCPLSNFVADDEFLRLSSTPWDVVGRHLCLDVAEGLAVMHKHGIVHGDIKPDNILVFLQENQDVPFIAKLSDFGVCIALQEDTVTSFAAYRGTPGWRPPEAARYTEEIHGPFKPDLLFRCDSFSYGLLVLSVLVTKGRPPLPALSENIIQTPNATQLLFSKVIQPLTGSWITDTSSGSTNTQESADHLKLALAVLNNATHLRESLQSQIRSLLVRVLQIKPEDRDLVDSDMLADSEDDGYRNWLRLKDIQIQSPVKLSFEDQSWRRGIKYWLRLEPKLLRELGEQYFSQVQKGEDPRFPGETLLGMAIAYLSGAAWRNQYRENIDKALGFMTASALQGFSPAQGICERLHLGLGRKLPENVGDTVRSQWLYNAASTGSLFANEILKLSNYELYTSARSIFREHGGYNNQHIQSIQTQNTLLEERILEDFMKKHDINKHVIDTQGNRLLHLASMVGNVTAISTLLSQDNTDVNIQNDIGETPLLLACKAGHANAVKILVEYHADASIVAVGFYSITPLHWLFNFDADDIPEIGRILVQNAHAPVNYRLIPLTTPAVSRNSEDEYPYGQIEAWHFPFHWPYGTPLHWAVFARSFAAIDVLSDLGGDLDAFNLESSDFGETALSIAANLIDVEIVDHLLKRGASPSKVDRRKRSPLHLLSEDTSDWSRGLLGWRGLRDWITCGTSAEHRLKVDRIVKLLLEAGCDIEGMALWGKDFPTTPLAYAASEGKMDANVTLSLVKSGAKIDDLVFLPPSGLSLLHLWAGANPWDLVYPDVYASVLNTLVAKAGTKLLNQQNSMGGTMLHKLMLTPSIPFETICQVVEHYRVRCGPINGFNIQDKQGLTPLHIAIFSYHQATKKATPEEFISNFCQWGADLTIVGYNRKNSLHLLGENDKLDDLPTLEFLQLFMASLTNRQLSLMIDQQDEDGLTPLMLMAANGRIKCVEWLVEAGADTEAFCTLWMKWGWTVLDCALKEAERYRHWFLVESHMYEVLRSGLHNYNLKARWRSDNLKDNFPQIVRYLRSKGVKRGNEVGRKTGGHYNPLTFDDAIFRETGLRVQTPEEWQFVYEELRARSEWGAFGVLSRFLERSLWGYINGGFS